MDDLHKIFEELKPKLAYNLTLEEVAKLAGMILKESNFTLNNEWLKEFFRELESEQMYELMLVVLEHFGKESRIALSKA